MDHAQFTELLSNAHILKAVAEEGYEEPTPVQAKAIPYVLAGRDVLATAQTGTGKTAAFSLPMLQTLSERKPATKGTIRALIVTPTRELALQIEESLRTYGRHLRLRTAVLLGGVSQEPQVRALRKGPEIVVATPGRLLDLVEQGFVKLDRIEQFVLDEADRMLDMGFVHDVRRIIALLPTHRQTLLFSATMSTDVVELASRMLKNPARVEVTPSASISHNIEQKVLFVDQANKRALLADVLRDASIRRALVFTRTKHGADRIARQLVRDGITVEAIHSNKSQGARQRALAAFARGSVKVLVATDIVARGIDVEGISHVINYEMPNTPESYVHRIGRTARAGAAGTALTFCDAGEVLQLRGIEKLTKMALTEVADHPFRSNAVASMRGPRPTSVSNAAIPESRRRFGRRNRPADRRARFATA